jgi:hypothetical protein
MEVFSQPNYFQMDVISENGFKPSLM